MNPHVLLSALLLAYAHAAGAQDCVRITCGQDDGCEVRPSQLTAALPPGLEIKSIRGNTKITSRGNAALLECRPAARLPSVMSADQASVYGSVQVTGKLHATGILRFEPNDGGDLEFRPGQKTFEGAGRFFKTNFTRIKLDEAQPPVDVAPPQSLAKADCWQANASAELSEFSVVIGDSSAAGTYARQAQITRISGFAKCTWGGE